MSCFRWLVLVLFPLLFPACDSRREQAQRTLREVGASTLREDGALLYKELFGGSGPKFFVVLESEWPPSFRRFAPKRIGAYVDGFALALETHADTERGVFVVPRHFAARTPSRELDATFEALAEGVFWYSFTRQPP